MLNATPNKNPEKIKSVPKLSSNRLTLLIVAVVLIVVVVIAIVFGGHGSTKKMVAQNCGPYRDDRAVTINKFTFKAEAPNNQAAFDKGLGGRPCILPNEAMIFPFIRPAQYAFWMKDMKFPIDIVWIDANHQVVANQINLKPSSYPNQYANPKQYPAQYVLEIKANQSKQLGITLGTIVQF